MSDVTDFDPNGVGVKGSLFGLPYTVDEAAIVVVPVPWDVTVSYGAGTANGPAAILEASPQIDYAQPDIEEAWKLPIAMAEIPQDWWEKGNSLRRKAVRYIDWLEEGSPDGQELEMLSAQVEINEHCAELMTYVEQECKAWQEQGKLTILLGGDHSTPLGNIRALAQQHESFGILQIDAHADLRNAYEGFVYSHASVMHNALKTPAVERLVQVGIRDFCEEEKAVIQNSEGRVKTFFDADLKAAMYRGKSWDSLCAEIVDALPDRVYLSFDIDGLDPKLCPNTGTPVPGGFELEQVMYLIKCLVDSGRTLIGADLNEVAPGADEWDANVGARALYRMALLMSQSNKAAH